jgi:AraC-like DNA-binding protein
MAHAPTERGTPVLTTRIARLAECIERYTGADGSHPTAVAELTLFRQSRPTELTAVLYEPSLCVIARGRKEVRLGDERHGYDPAHFLLVSVDLPVCGRVTHASAGEPYLGLQVTLDPATVGELLADGVDPPAAPSRGLAVSALDPPLLDAVSRLVELAAAPPDVPALAPLVLREITYRLLTGPQGGRLRQIASAGAPAQRIAKAIRWLRDHFADPLSVTELARQVRLSPSAFHQHFKTVTALSPLQYQKRLRLQEARRLMLGDGLDAGEAAFRVGYESPSQFSREYRRLFGAPPRQDVTALRLGPTPAPAV